MHYWVECIDVMLVTFLELLVLLQVLDKHTLHPTPFTPYALRPVSAKLSMLQEPRFHVFRV